MRVLILFFALLFAMSGCRKMTLNKTEKRLSDGEWEIYLYSENGVNLTDKGYSEYTFTFDGSGGINARIPSLGVNVVGIYEMKIVNKVPLMKIIMYNPLENLNEDWEIEEQHKAKVELRSNNTKSKRLVFLKK